MDMNIGLNYRLCLPQINVKWMFHSLSVLNIHTTIKISPLYWFEKANLNISHQI